jgi:hypothetical protein
MSTSLEMLLHNLKEIIVATTAISNTRLSNIPLRAGAYAAFIATIAGSLYFEAEEKVMERQQEQAKSSVRV